MGPFLVPPKRQARTTGDTPSFSVLVPAYQAAETIGPAIASALNQTLPAKEVIVCDDGSTDDLESALEPYRDGIVFLQQPNGGGASALNTALAAASGDFVVLLDADDVCESRRLEALGALAAARGDLDILMTDLILEVDGRDAGRWLAENPFPIVDQRRILLERCYIAVPAVRTEPLRAAGGFNESLRTGYDWECWIRLVAGGSLAGLVDVPLYRYRINPKSLTTADRAGALRDRCSVLRSVRTDPRLTEEDRRALQAALTRMERRAGLAEAEAALRSGASDGRRRALAVALGSGFGPRERLKAGVAAIAPRAAGARLRRRAARTGESRLTRSVRG